ncbi:cyclic nucleotide-binding domain-containing protein [Enterococcus sp. LJL90]
MKREKFSKKYENVLTRWQLNPIDYQKCEIFTYKPRETVLEEGSQVDYVFLVVSGRAKVCNYTTNGKNLVLSYFISSGIFGDIELISEHQTATATIITVSEFVCIGIPKNIYQQRLLNNLGFVTLIAKGLAENVVTTSKNQLASSFYAGEERLAFYLWQNAYKNYFEDNLTDTAASVGLSYRHLFRILNQFVAEGYLKKKGKGYLILNEAALKALSFPEN